MAGKATEQLDASHEKAAVLNSSGSASDSTTEHGPADAETDILSSAEAPPPLFVLPSDAEKDAGTSGGADLQRASTSGTDNESYPEGGLQAWLVVFGCWLALVASLGVANTMGTFQSYLISHQLADVDEGNVGWVFSLYTFVLFFLGLYIGPIFDKYGPRWIVLAGSLLMFAGLMLFSISSGMYTHTPLAVLFFSFFLV